MRGLTRTAGAAALAATLALSGCVTLGGYDTAPNGLSSEEAALRRGLAEDAAALHEAVVEGERDLPDDDLLRLLFAGTTGRYAARYRESSQFLDVAGYVAEDRVTESLSRQALSFITSDRALPYTPSRTERLMIPYVSALNFLDDGDLRGAVVEARRIEALLDVFDEGTPRSATPADSRFLHALAATIFDAAGETNAADVAYRRAGAPDPPAVPPELEHVPADSLGEVVLVVERGYVPHRVEQSVIVLLPPFQVQALTDGSAGDKAAAAAAAAARIVAAAAVLHGGRGPYYTDHSYRETVQLSPWDDCDRRPRPSYCHSVESDNWDPYFLRISWPVLYQDPAPRTGIRVRVAGRAVRASSRLDVSAGIRRDFSDERPTILARTVFRAATKMALSSSAESAVAQHDSGAGRLVGFLVNLGTLLTERADTRSWNLLPGTVELVRIRVPAGTHRVSIDGNGWLDEDIDLGAVTVRAGETTFVTHRIWR